MQIFQFLADPPRFLGAVPHADDAHLVARIEFGPQRLAEAVAVLRNQRRRGRQYLRGRPVILLEPDYRRAGKVLFEAQDVRDLGAAPRIDRLVVVADAADILARLRQQPQPEILAGVGILIFIDEDIFEALLIMFEHIAVIFQDHQHVQQQVAEIAGVERLQPRLIQRIEMAALAVGIGFPVARIKVGRRQAAVLPLVDQRRELARRPALFIESLGLDDLLEHAKLVVGVEDGEIALQANEFGVTAQHFRADAVKSAQPRHALDRVADHPPDAFAHLARRPVGEGDGQDFRRPGAPRRDDMRQPRRQCGGLARAGSGEHQHRPFGGENGLPLRAVQAVQIGRVRRRGRWQFGEG